MLKRVLVATDFSVNADHALRFALDLARRANAELVLLHVTMPFPASAPLAERSDHERLTAAARRLLDERVVLAAPRGVAMRAMVKAGLAADVIAATALDEGADVVVVGTHGRDEDAAPLIGSVGERIVRIAPCTVIVVKPPLLGSGS
jgi:universal stress protein A